MLLLVRQILRSGLRTEPAPEPNDAWRVDGERVQGEILRLLGRALTIRQVDAGSCNGCELEIHALNNPYYNLEGRGIRFVASPRHADMLLVTGPVAANMKIAVQRAYEATPEPKLVVAVGDCGCTGGIFGELRQLRPGCQRHPGRRGDSRLPATAAGDPARHPDRRRGEATVGRAPPSACGWPPAGRIALLDR